MQAMRDLVDYVIVLSDKDNVATALADVPSGDYALSVSDKTDIIRVTEAIRAGFKVALSPIEPGETVYKYGYPIGVAKALIRPGDCVHIHNMTSSYSVQGINQK
jgi:hypothetical protein